MPSVQFSAAPDPHTDWHTRPVCRSVFCDGKSDRSHVVL